MMKAAQMSKDSLPICTYSSSSDSDEMTSFFQIVASLYLVMVVVMVGLNYRLRGRSTSKSRSRSSEDAVEELEEAEGEASLEPIPYRAASVCFTEAKGSFSSLVSAETWAPALPSPPRPPARLVTV